MKKFILIFSLLIFTVLLAPTPIFAAKKVDYIDTKVFGGSGWDSGYSVTVDKLNNIYVVGYFEGTSDFNFTSGTDNHTSNGSYDIFLTKINADGTYGYTKTFGSTGDDEPYWVSVDSLNNVYIASYFYGTVDFDSTNGTDNHTSNGGSDISMTKINSDGSYGYTKTIGGTGDDWPNKVVLDPQNNIYMTGAFEGTLDFDFTGGVDNNTSNGSNDAFVTKINSDETYGYTKTFGGSGYESGRSIVLDNLNNLYVTGPYNGTVDFDFTGTTDNHTSNGSGDIFVTKIKPDGTYGYTKTFGGIGDDGGYRISIDSLNNIYVTGDFYETADFDYTGGIDNHTSNGNNDAFITKINSDQTYAWTKTFGGTGYEWGASISIDNQNNIYVGGYFGGTVDFDPGIGITNKTTISNYNYDTFIASYDKDGNFKWVKTLSSNEGSSLGQSMVSNNKLYAIGEFGVTTDFNPDGPSDIITTDPNWSAFLTTYQLYFPGVIKTESGGSTSIVPNLTTDSVTLKLDAEPNSDVMVILDSTDGSLTYSPSSLTFTPANYSTPQTVTISSATPVGSNTTKNMTFTLTSSDTDYNGLTITPLSVGVNLDNSDTVAPSKVVITNIGSISNIPNKDILRYFFTSQTPVIKGTSEANSTVYFVVNGHTYSTVTGSDGKFSITLSNPSLERNKNIIVYFAKDSYLNKSAERTLELTVGEENFPVNSSSSSSSSSTSSEISSSSSSSSTSSLSSSSTSSASSSSTSSIEVILPTKEITIKDENGSILPNTRVIINGKTYTTDSKGTVKAEVAGVYIVEYDKGGVKYASTIKSSESIVTLKAIPATSVLVYIILGIVGLLVLVIILMAIFRRRKSNLQVN